MRWFILGAMAWLWACAGSSPAADEDVVVAQEPGNSACQDEEDGCEPGQFCQYPLGACGKGTGQCAVTPVVCTMDYDPVCGCDGKTYSNACAAQSAAVSLRSKGACG